MPNWTFNHLKAKGLDSLPVFREVDGKRYFDFNKIIPIPDYVEKTIFPVNTQALACYLILNFGKDSKKIMKEYKLDDKIINEKTLEEWEEFAKESTPGILFDDEAYITMYELGENYYKSKLFTGCFDWYEWAIKNWGVKWNASGFDCFDCNNEDETMFETPWDYPDPIYRELALRYPDMYFDVFVEFEDDPYTTYHLEYHGEYMRETSYPNDKERYDYIDLIV